MQFCNSAVGVGLQKGVCKRYEALMLHFLCKIGRTSLASNIQPYAKARAKEAGACEGSRRPNAVEVWWWWWVLKKRGQG